MAQAHSISEVHKRPAYGKRQRALRNVPKLFVIKLSACMMNLFKSKSNKNKHLICIHLFPSLNKIKMVRCAVSKLFSSLILLCRFKNWRVATNVSNNFNTMTNREQKVIKMKQAKDKDILINIISTYLKRSKAERNTFPFSEKYKYLKPLPVETETNRILVCSASSFLCLFFYI